MLASESASSVNRPTAGRQAIGFFLLGTGSLSIAGLIAWLLVTTVGTRGISATIAFQPAFVIGTLLLAAGSLCLVKARRQVQIERQVPFRRWMLAANVAGTLFVGIQCYGLWCLTRTNDPTQAETGVTAFVFVLVALHGLHFVVAQLCLSLVTVRAFADRYDHEYYWGVTVSGWFWHALGIIWLGVLAVLTITAVW